MNAKTCPRCGEVRPISAFGANRSARDGLQVYCRACNNEASRLSRNSHPETNQAYRARKHDRILETRRAYRNREKAREVRALWRELHRVEVNAQNRQRRRNNLERYRELGRLFQRARRASAGPVDEAARDYARVLACDPCSYCGGPGGEVDHIVPVVAGGGNEGGNLTAACRSCNASKGSRSLLTFFLQRRPTS